MKKVKKESKIKKILFLQKEKRFVPDVDCVCVSQRERERERDSGRERFFHKFSTKVN